MVKYDYIGPWLLLGNVWVRELEGGKIKPRIRVGPHVPVFQSATTQKMPLSFAYPPAAPFHVDG